MVAQSIRMVTTTTNLEDDMDIYKLDTRVTVLFSRAQADALQEIARQDQTSVSGLIRAMVTNKMEQNSIWNRVYRDQLKKLKEKHSD